MKPYNRSIELFGISATGKSYMGEVEVLEGMRESDKIIVKGARNIKDGEIVEVYKN